MKTNYLLLAFLLSTLFAVAQTPKKIRALNFTGIELGQEVGFYKSFNTGKLNDHVVSGDFDRYLPANTSFYNYFGKTMVNGGNPYTMQSGNWDGSANAVSLVGLFSFANKDKSALNKHHQLRIGLGYGERYYTTSNFSSGQSFGRDTVSINYIQGDTVYIMTDSISRVNAWVQPSVTMGLVGLGYIYTLSPGDKVTLGFGGGVDMGVGVISVYGDITQTNERKYYGYGKGSDTTAWQYLITHYGKDLSPKTTRLEEIDNRSSVAYMVRPHIAARLDYRLSKKSNFFKHFNLFCEGRVGWEYSNADNLSDKHQNRYVSVRFGINYYLSNIIGG